MKIGRKITRYLSMLLVCLLLFTDCGTRFINSGGLSTVHAEEAVTETYVDYLTKAEELGTPLAVYNYIKNNVNYEYYSGIRKGSQAVYDSLGGNDADQAILLSEMLKHIGYETRYVEGRIRLTGQQLYELTGEADIQVAADVLSMGEQVTCMYDQEGNFLYAEMDHIWVEASVPYGEYRGNGANSGEYLWIPLDTSIKRYEENDTVYDHFEEYGLSGDEGLVTDAVMASELMDEWQKKAELLISENPDLYLTRRKIVEEELFYLPLSLQYGVAETYGTYENLSYVEKDSIAIRLSGQSLGELTPADIYNKRLTVSYIAEGSLLKARLLLEGEVLGEGSAVAVGTEETLTITVKSNGTSETITNSIHAGGVYQITTNAQNITAHELNTALEKLNGIREQVTEENVFGEEYLGLLLDYAGKLYFAQVDAESRMLAEKMHVHTGRSLSVGMTGYQPGFMVDMAGNKSLTGTGNLFIDVDHDARITVSGNGNKEDYNLLAGMISSVYESVIWEMLTGDSAVSSMSLLGGVAETGEDLQILCQSNLEEKRSELKLDAATFRDIESKIQEGSIVIVTKEKQSVDNWSGTGYIVLDAESFAGQYMISGGLNGGSSALEVGAAYLVSTVIFIVELIQTLTIIHSIVSCLAMGSVIGMLGVVFWSALMLSTIAMLTMAYLECTWLLVEYANGNMEAGEQLILNTKINLACTVIFAFGGKVAAPILQKSAVKKLVTTFGDDMADLMLMRFADPQQLWKCVKQLRKADFTDDVIRTLVFQMDNASFVKLSQMAAKNLPKGLLHALSQNEAAIRNITNVADLAVFKNTQKSWDVIVQLLAEKGDDFIRVYRLYQDEVVEVLAVCGSDAITYVDLYQKAFLDMALAHGAVYKALYDKYGAEYGQELTAKCILYMDELFDMVTRYGDEVVSYVITYGDEVMDGIRTHQKTYVDLLLKHKDIFVRMYKAHKGAAVTLFTTYGDDILASPELYTDEVLSYVITYGDDVVNGIRAHQKTYVNLLLKHKDIFVRTYKAHKEAAVTLFTTYGDDILTSPELYTDEVLSYVITYGDDVVNGIRMHQKTYVDLLLKHKDIFVRMYEAHGEGAVTAFTTYADDILASPELYTDEVLFYVIAYGDDVVNGIRAHQKTYVDLLLTHKDIFVRMYKAHVESAVTTFTTYADDILKFPEQYKDKAVELLIEYGEAVVDGLRNHYDDFMKRYADEGVEFVKEYLEKGDEVFEGGLKSGKDLIKNISKIEYGTDKLSKVAIEFRKANNITSARRNVCVVEYKNADGTIVQKAFASNASNHSEELMIDFLKADNISGEDVIKIFTEREPCVETATNVGHNCTNRIIEYAPDAEVTYAVDYGVTQEDGLNARNILQELLQNLLN